MTAVVLTPTKECETVIVQIQRDTDFNRQKDKHKSKNFNYFGDIHVLKTRKWVNLTESC